MQLCIKSRDTWNHNTATNYFESCNETLCTYMADNQNPSNPELKATDIETNNITNTKAGGTNK